MATKAGRAYISLLRTVAKSAGVLLVLSPLSGAAAGIEVKTSRVTMTGQAGEGYRPYAGNWGPVSKAHLTGISVPKDFAKDLQVSFVKPGFTTAHCGNPDALVILLDGQATTTAQIKELFGAERVPATDTIKFRACLGVKPFKIIDKFFIIVHYEKEVDEEEPDDPPKPDYPALKERSYNKIDEYTRVDTLFCQQLHNNKGCGMNFSCPAGYVLTNARAACDLETGRKETLPKWGQIKVGRSSDQADKGLCRLGDLSLRTGTKSIPSATFSVITNPSSYQSGLYCDEHDENGGDCSIVAELRCQLLNREVEKVVPFSCSKGDSNDGCKGVAACPADHIVTSVRASCDLETVRTPDLGRWGWIEVIRPSDLRGQGHCVVRTMDVSQTKPVINGVVGSPKLGFGCRENDKNGGDCHIKGELKCSPLLTDRVTGVPPLKIE
jgi:hypothetical protein